MPVYFSPAYNATVTTFDTVHKASSIAKNIVDTPVPGVKLVEPRPASHDELASVHDTAYIDAVRTGSPAELAASSDLDWDPGMFAAVCASSGGARDAALHALNTGGIAGSLSSGLHHARRAHGAGNCTFNGLVIAAKAALGAGAKRVLIIDLDAHCGGGTSSMIAGVAGIEQIDVAVDNYDHYQSDTQSRLVVTNGVSYLDVIAAELDGVNDPGCIDLVLYNAGMDPHERCDTGGVAGIDTEVLRRREELVFAWAGRLGLPVAWVLAGGYIGPNLDMSELVALHRLTVETAAQQY